MATVTVVVAGIIFVVKDVEISSFTIDIVFVDVAVSPVFVTEARTVEVWEGLVTNVVLVVVITVVFGGGRCSQVVQNSEASFFLYFIIPYAKSTSL